MSVQYLLCWQCFGIDSYFCIITKTIPVESEKQFLNTYLLLLKSITRAGNI